MTRAVLFLADREVVLPGSKLSGSGGPALYCFDAEADTAEGKSER